MQLLLLILAAFILGYWFSRSNAASRLTKTARDLGNRLRRKPGANPTDAEGEKPV